MTIREDLADKKLEIDLQNGTTSSGAAVIKKITFSNVKLAATKEDLYAAGEAYASLTSRPLVEVSKWDKGVLTKEE